MSAACAFRVGAETLLKVYGVKVDPEEFSAFAGMGEVSPTSPVTLHIVGTSPAHIQQPCS